MAFVSSLILRSMRMIGEKTRGEALTADEQVETLAEFNSFLDTCELERLLCYTLQENAFAYICGYKKAYSRAKAPLAYNLV